MTTDVNEIKAAVDKLTDQVRAQAEKAIAEAARGIKMTEDQKGVIDEMMVKQSEARAELDDLLQKFARRSAPGIITPDTPGYKFIESETFKKLAENGSRLRKGESMSVEVKAITSLGASAGTLVGPDRQAGVLTLPQRPLTVRDLVAPGRTASNLIQYFRETVFTNNAAPVAENTRKPESNLTFDQADAKVIKLAHFIKATTEILADAPALQSTIDQRLRYGLEFVEDLQLLMGSGVGNNLNGLYTQATAFVAPITVASPTRLDILRLAFLQAELALLPADAAVLHPSDWAAIELTKDTQNRYIIGNPQGEATQRLWGRRIVTSLAMTADTFLAGNFRQSAQIFDRENANVVVSTENEDDFVNNRITILAEERLALAVYRPQALIKGDLTPA